MPKQLTHNQVKNTVTKKEIIVVSDNIRTPENVGMLFRISEAFGVKKVILVGDSPNLSNKKVIRTARSTEKELEISFEENSKEILHNLKENNFQLIGLELTDTSKEITKYNFSKIQKIALFIGAERYGIDADVLTQLNDCVHINLFGKNSSVNVVNALGIALFEMTR